MGDKSLAYIFESLVIIYVTQQVGLPESMILVGLLISSAVQFVTVPLFAAWSDRIGRRPVYMCGAILSALFAYPFFLLMDTGNMWLIWLSLIFASGVAKTMMTAAQAGWYAEMFPAPVRYSGFSLAREGMAPISGGIAPLVAVTLLAVGGGDPIWVVAYIVGLSLITLISVYLGPETYQVDMFPKTTDESTPDESTATGAAEPTKQETTT